MRTGRRRFLLDGGIVLMYALSILVILTLIGLSLQTTGSSLMQLAKQSQYRRLAQGAADSGIRYGVAYIRGILDPLNQYTSQSDPTTLKSTTGSPPDYPTLDSSKGHLFNCSGMTTANKDWPVHPCNIYWRLKKNNSDVNSIDSWVYGNKTYTTQVASVAVDPTQAAGASNPLMYITSFTISVAAVCVRTMAGINSGTSSDIGTVVSTVGLRWRDLVDLDSVEYCHDTKCSGACAATTPTVSYTATCWTCVTNAKHRSDTSPVTRDCTFSRHKTQAYVSQPYMLFSTGYCYINDPANPGSPLTSAAATVASTALIGVTCRTEYPEASSSHATYAVTLFYQDRGSAFY